MSDIFYQSMPAFSQFEHVAKSGYTHPVPDDWWIAITDVKDSTKAIEDGRYRDVNLAGAACIIAAINACKGHNIPYVFGGYGATLLIPPTIKSKVQAALCSVQTKVRDLFDLDLRAGFISVRALYDQGAILKLGKYQISPHVQQAVLQGNGVGLAEKWLKCGSPLVQFCAPKSSEAANLEGLECRWKPIQQKKGEILSILIKVTAEEESQSLSLYQSILRAIVDIYPDTLGTQPKPSSGEDISLSPVRLSNEARLRTSNKFSEMVYLLGMMTGILVARASLLLKKPVLGFNGRRYFHEVVANTDARKFDDMLRFVFDSTPEQKQKLQELLDSYKQKGEITYGIHSASSALMTCLVFSRDGNHIHFIDGSNGGYALAAKQMKL